MSFDDADDDGAKKRKQAGHMQEIHDAIKRALAARSGPLWRSEAIISSPDHDAYDEYDPFGVDAPLMPCADTMDSLSEFVHSAIAYRRRADKTEYAAAASGALGDQDPRAQEAPPSAQVAAAPAAAVIPRKGKGPTGATAKAAAAPASASLDEDADGGHGAVPAPASKAGSSPRVTNPKGGIQGRAAAAPAAKAAPAAAAAAAAAAVEAPAAGSKRRRAAKDQEDAVDHEERDDGPASASGLAKSSSKAQKKRNDRA